MNLDIFHFLNGLMHEYLVLDYLMVFLIRGSDIIVPGLLVAFFLFGFYRKRPAFRHVAIHAFCLMLSGLLIGRVIGLIVDKSRPLYAMESVNVLLTHSDNSSFPSNHTTFIFAAAFAFYFFHKRIGIALAVLGLFVGVAKVFMAHHFPIDIVMTIIYVAVLATFYRLFLLDRVSRLYDYLESKALSRFE